MSEKDEQDLLPWVNFAYVECQICRARTPAGLPLVHLDGCAAATSKPLTREQVVQLAIKLQLDIESLLADFEARSGAAIDSVEVKKLHYTRADRERPDVYFSVKVYSDWQVRG